MLCDNRELHVPQSNSFPNPNTAHQKNKLIHSTFPEIRDEFYLALYEKNVGFTKYLDSTPDYDI